MNYSKYNTAILLFARSAEYETTQKNFQSGLSRKCNIEISRKLCKAAHFKCVSVGIPVYHIDETRQKGSNFSERLKDSLSQVFNEGFENVIAVGNDCPTLSAQDMINAQRALENGQSAIGKTQKGGVYLLGLTKNQYTDVNFSAIEWGTKNVYNQLKKFLTRSKTPIILKTKREINRISDIVMGHFNELNELVKCLISLALNRIYLHKDGPRLYFISINSNISFRGPPH